MKRTLITTLAAGSLLLGAGAIAQDKTEGLPKTDLQVVGGLSNLTAYQNFEQPFWTKTVPELSGGQVTATIKGFNEMGLKGPELLRLIGQGVIPIGTATMAYFASDNPMNEGIDLAGIAPSAKVAHEITDAFEPVFEKYYANHNIKVLGFSPYPAQVLFCNADISGLADVKGKKVRTSSRTTAEFVQALGGSSVTLPFGEVVPALQNGVVDCAITGSMSGYSAKWYMLRTRLTGTSWTRKCRISCRRTWTT
jgi:TRAP-type C4-dicarboxylate transport system substrate-binding protein